MPRPTGAETAGKTFPYRFHVSTPRSGGNTTVIFVPGGPGQTSIEAGLSYPDEDTIVRTDPRGVGCNEDPSITRDSFRSEVLARDVLAIVRELRPRRYILHGLSYGTIVATWAAALAADEGVPAPAALVLEGTIGRPFAPGEYQRGYFRAWKDVRAALSPTVLEQLRAHPVPVGESGKDWAAWLTGMLAYGDVPAGSFAASELGLLDPARESGRRALELRVRKLSEAPSAAKTRVYREIVCREFTPDVRDVKFDFDWRNGGLVDAGGNLCEGLPFDRPFEACSLPITTPVYYFSGGLDPATPPWQAKAHARGRTSPVRFVDVPRGGHAALSMSLADCGTGVWRAIADGGERLESALGACALATRVQRNDAGQAFVPAD